MCQFLSVPSNVTYMSSRFICVITNGRFPSEEKLNSIQICVHTIFSLSKSAVLVSLGLGIIHSV